MGLARAPEAADARIAAWVRLQLAGLSARALAQLLRAFGSPEAVLGATPAQRRRHAPPSAAALLEQPVDDERLRATLQWLTLPGHSLAAWDDADYPRPLLEIGDPPPVFYCQGRRELLGAPALAIVGSRNATPQGCADAEAFAFALSAAGLTIVSGLAIGIDAAAHRGGLRERGSSIAVVGTGLDRVYPARNRPLAHAVAETGLLVSEFALGTPAAKHNFPRRNRIVSGLARGVLVVEATLSSGSLITAAFAAEQGRDVFALPGSIHSPFSKGTHKLIREGAKLVETAQDILEELRMDTAAQPPAAAAATTPGREAPRSGRRKATDTAAGTILRALGFDAVDIDTLAARSGLSIAEITATLTTLELERRVNALPGGLWQRIG